MMPFTVAKGKILRGLTVKKRQDKENNQEFFVVAIGCDEPRSACTNVYVDHSLLDTTEEMQGLLSRIDVAIEESTYRSFVHLKEATLDDDKVLVHVRLAPTKETERLHYTSTEKEETFCKKGGELVFFETCPDCQAVCEPDPQKNKPNARRHPAKSSVFQWKSIKEIKNINIIAQGYKLTERNVRIDHFLIEMHKGAQIRIERLDKKGGVVKASVLHCTGKTLCELTQEEAFDPNLDNEVLNKRFANIVTPDSMSADALDLLSESKEEVIYPTGSDIEIEAKLPREDFELEYEL